MGTSKSTTLSQTSTADNQHAEPTARKLFLLRCLWLLSAPVLIALTCYFLSLQVSLVQTVCTGDNCSISQPNPGTLLDLEQLGLSLNAVTVIIVSIIGACALTWFVIAVIIARKNFSNWFALSVSLLALIQMAMAARPPEDLFYNQETSWQWIAIAILMALNYTIYVVVGSLFPNGRLAPRWTRMILLSWLVIGLPCFLLSTLPSLLPLEWQNLLEIVSIYCWLLCIAAIIVAQVYRYLRFYSPVERQQTKWVLFFGSIALMVQVILYSLNLITVLFNPGSLFSLFYYPTIKLFLTLFGLSLLFSMLRYRLYEIDILINRTLVYGSLTALLALLYFSLIFALQTLFQGGVHQNNAVAIVVSTLVIAALFQPLRHRIQAIIDRRFYRRKYDAAKTLESFSATLRNEVDLGQLREQLLNVVQETMQPAHVSLWLRSPQHDGKLETLWRANPPDDSKEG
jgi:hypothetical protein